MGRRRFFRILAGSFYDFEGYVDLALEGARSALWYLFRLVLLLAAVLLAIHTADQYIRLTGYLEAAKPAFKDFPALSWKDRRLTAEGQVPFRATVHTLGFSMAVDTRETPDRSLLEGEKEAVLLTADRFVRRIDGEDEVDTPYDARLDGQTFPAGTAYRMKWPEPANLISTGILLPALLGTILFFLFLAGSGGVIVAGLSLAVVPDGRRLGLGGVWAMAVQGATPGLVLLAGIQVAAALFVGESATRSRALPWLALGLPLVLSVGLTVVALRANREPTSPRPKPKRTGKPESLDRDLLPPDKV